MNKSELVALMATRSSGSKAEAERALNLVIESIFAALRAGNNISLVGFGSFNIRERKARDGVNPKTRQKMLIPAYKQPVFRAGNKMKKSCN